MSKKHGEKGFKQVLVRSDGVLGFSISNFCFEQRRIMRKTFRIESEYIELIKLLKAAGLCSTGGIAKIVTNEGRVKVDGHTELRKRCKIRKGQTIEFEGDVIEVE